MNSAFIKFMKEKSVEIARYSIQIFIFSVVNYPSGGKLSNQTIFGVFLILALYTQLTNLKKEEINFKRLKKLIFSCFGFSYFCSCRILTFTF